MIAYKFNFDSCPGVNYPEVVVSHCMGKLLVNLVSHPEPLSLLEAAVHTNRPCMQCPPNGIY